MRFIRRRLIIIGVAILATLAAGTAGFMLIDGYPAFDAFYMTLITITTVGYQEVHPLSRAGRIFNSFLIAIGVTVLFLAIGAITQTAIELELNQYFGRRRIKAMIDKLKDHYIVCGYGRVGRGAAAALKDAGVPFVIIDRGEDLVERAIHEGMLAVLADANSDETLRNVGIMKAAALIATLSTDADNLFLVVSARTMNPSLRISARVSEKNSEDKFRRAGAEFVFAPYDITGHRMAESLIRPHVFQFLDFTLSNKMELDVGLEQISVSEKSPLASQTLAQLQVRRDFGVIVLAIRKEDGNMQFNPPADAVIVGGDCLIVMGEHDALQRLEKMLTEVKA